MVGTTERRARGVPAHLELVPERSRQPRWRTLQVELAEKPSADKNLAIICDNNPAGKGNIGASYVNPRAYPGDSDAPGFNPSIESKVWSII